MTIIILSCSLYIWRVYTVFCFIIMLHFIRFKLPTIMTLFLLFALPESTPSLWNDAKCLSNVFILTWSYLIVVRVHSTFLLLFVVLLWANIDLTHWMDAQCCPAISPSFPLTSNEVKLLFLPLGALLSLWRVFVSLLSFMLGVDLTFGAYPWQLSAS